MQATNVDMPDAAQQRQVVLDAMRSSEMRAYAVDGTDLLGGLVDFPVPAHGPSFVWVGYWKTANARRARTTPPLLIGTALKTDRVTLHHRLGLAPDDGQQALPRAVTLETPNGIQERLLVAGSGGRAFVDFEDDDTAVTLVISDIGALPAYPKITTWTDREKLIDEWISLFD